ncbi:AI-2E family transporter [Acinetobacter sp. MD2(2019)]|uniref:AI-2E family transporter n=1 Tax=Acinetobacter sp. MD2(2019) TaxID=2605273 RepID=UPI002D1E6476|nr:AI-2E family transporter [Acinetobacter sp. MD2(2019)]MEB3753400.1 AI-2E family transporter [Acinetobacter sp. MD2(2019)]
MNILHDKPYVLASYIIIFVSLLCIIPLHLLPSFFAGFIIYEIINALSTLFDRYIDSHRAKLIISVGLSVIIVSLLAFLLTSLISFVVHDVQGVGISTVGSKADLALEQLRVELSKYIPVSIPSSVADLKNEIFELLKDNVSILQHTGSDILHNIATMLIGMIIGILVSLHSLSSSPQPAFKLALLQRIDKLSTSFRNVVFAQFQISLINTVLFIVFVFIILPLFHVHLPFAKTLTILTFIFGLIPIAGNLMSNTLIIISGLTVSLPVAGAALAYLVIIHKLEYFINAQIVGNKINARAWEVLLAMLVFESIFGFGGLIAAPIFYAYLKRELRDAGLI